MLTSVKQGQNFAWVYNAMVVIIICLFMEKSSLSLKPIIKMLSFWLDFVYEAYLMDVMLLSLEQGFKNKISATFPSIKMLLISLTY